VTLATYARVIKLIGAEHFLISSDMGQMANPPHVKAMRSFILGLKELGLSDEQIDLVARKNPAKLLGLEP
jgi:predicted metal-dependent TIM-barrel fold hydrolase